MKKRTRSLLSLVLAALLTVSLAVPAMASIDGDGTSNGHYYKFSIDKKTSSGVAYIVTPNAPAYVTAKAVNYLDYSIGSSPVKVSRTLTGYASASATAGNSFTHNGITKTASIDCTTAEFKVGANIVVPENFYTIGS